MAQLCRGRRGKRRHEVHKMEGCVTHAPLRLGSCSGTSRKFTAECKSSKALGAEGLAAGRAHVSQAVYMHVYARAICSVSAQ